MTPKTELFKRDLEALLKKYNATIEIKEPESYIESHKKSVFFDSVWDNNANELMEESQTLVLGSCVIP